MTGELVRYQECGHLHLITSSCYRRLPYLAEVAARELFERSLEAMRIRYDFLVVPMSSCRSMFICWSACQETRPGDRPRPAPHLCEMWGTHVYWGTEGSLRCGPPAPIYGGQQCRGTDNLVADVSLYIPAPPPVIGSIDPPYALRGGQGTLTVSGSNFANYNGDRLVLNFSGGGSPFTLMSTQTPCTSGCTAAFSYDVSGYAAGPSYQVWLSNNEAESEPVSFPIYSKSLVTSGPAPFSCAVSSNQAAGFTSIVPSGINLGISGNFSVSFGGSEFAGINPTVAYGPYSTPESIAASMAALITRNYAQYAKAFGRNVIYSGTATTSSGSGTLGLVTNVFSGNGGASSSFVANPSPTAPNEAEMACESAPPPPPTSVCGPDPGPRAQINVPAKITRAKELLSPQCQAKFADKFKSYGYTTTKVFSNLSKATFCQYPNTIPAKDSASAYATTRPLDNTIDLDPNFYSLAFELNGNRQPLTLIHEGNTLVRKRQPDRSSNHNRL